MGLEKLSDAADTTVAKVVDIIGLAKAIHDVAEIREAGNHVADGDVGDARKVEVGTDHGNDVLFLADLIVRVNLNSIDGAVGVESGVDNEGLGELLWAVLEEFDVTEMLDVIFGEGVSLDEWLAILVADFIAIVIDDILSEDAAWKSLVETKLLGVFETASAAKVISLWIEEFLN